MRGCLILLTVIVNLSVCRDFYVGMFKKNDFLVAQDRLYKEKAYHRTVTAKYGRIFKCPITYFRVVDRLGIGRGPKVEIMRGGLRKNFIVLRLISVYNYPISVNIYVGCENKMARIQNTLTTTGKENIDANAIDADTGTTPVTTVINTEVSSNDTMKDNKVDTAIDTKSNGTIDNSTTGNKTK